MTQTRDIPIHMRIRELQRQIHAEYGNPWRHNWTRIRALQDERDGLQEQIRLNAPRNMHAMTHEMLLDAIDLTHAQAPNYKTSGLQSVVRETFGVEPSRRTIRRWVADCECRDAACPCHRIGLGSEEVPENFPFVGFEAVEVMA